MYLEKLAGVPQMSEMDNFEKEKFYTFRDSLIREFLPNEVIKEVRNILNQELMFDKDEGEGCYYGLIDQESGKVYFSYYFSDFEFGSGLRKNDNDKRLRRPNWKIFMMKKLYELSPELAKQYFADWNKVYEDFMLKKNGDSSWVKEDIEENSKIGLEIITDNTASV